MPATHRSECLKNPAVPSKKPEDRKDHQPPPSKKER